MPSYDAAVDAFEKTLEALELELHSQKRLDRGFLEHLGRRGALLATAEITWLEHLGPLYTWSQAAEVLGTVTTRQGIHDLARRGQLLALPGKREKLYPAFQFRSGRTLAGLDKILAVLHTSDASPWTQASWFVTPQDELDGQSPVAYLTDRDCDEHVMDSARRAAARLAA